MSRLRLPAWALFAIGTVLVLFALLGITNSVHVIAKVVYALLMLIGLACGGLGVRRRRAANGP